MIATLKEYQSLLEELHDGIRQALVDLSQAGVDWSPGPGTNSLGVLAAHIAGSERYWIGTVAGNDPLPRDRDSEFRTVGVPAARLLAQLDEVFAHSNVTLARITPFDLEEVRLASRDGRKVTVSWALLHALEHDAQHMGHMQLMRDLWEMTGRNGAES